MFNYNTKVGSVQAVDVAKSMIVVAETMMGL
jgi:hypothetical protein